MALVALWGAILMAALGRLTVSVEVLSLGVVSPLGCATAAVLTRLVTPELAAMAAVTVKVTEPAGSSVTDSLMSPVPLVVVTLEPDDAAAVQVSPAKPGTLLNGSVTVWF